MKTQEEIELIAESAYPIKDDIYADLWSENNAFKKGYSQCQEDIIEELEMHILINEHDWNRNPQAQLKDFINSLYKK